MCTEKHLQCILNIQEKDNTAKTCFIVKKKKKCPKTFKSLLIRYIICKFDYQQMKMFVFIFTRKVPVLATWGSVCPPHTTRIRSPPGRRWRGRPCCTAGRSPPWRSAGSSDRLPSGSRGTCFSRSFWGREEASCSGGTEMSGCWWQQLCMLKVIFEISEIEKCTCYSPCTVNLQNYTNLYQGTSWYLLKRHVLFWSSSIYLHF